MGDQDTTDDDDKFEQYIETTFPEVDAHIRKPMSEIVGAGDTYSFDPIREEIASATFEDGTEVTVETDNTGNDFTISAQFNGDGPEVHIPVNQIAGAAKEVAKDAGYLEEAEE